MPAPLSMVSATRARGDVQRLHAGEPKIVQWASRQARRQRMSMIDGIASEAATRQNAPQLPRFGMSVALEYF
jgi:hypothetical protein